MTILDRCQDATVVRQPRRRVDEFASWLMQLKMRNALLVELTVSQIANRLRGTLVQERPAVREEAHDGDDEQ